ncbi:MAG: hypothetical protein IKM66_06690 [Clostridia bacterium]|nr:hypothetical protein [Clostridia bacterium]
MIQTIAIDELSEFIIKPIKDMVQTIIDSFEDMQTLIEELEVISNDKETYPYAFYQVKIIVPQVNYKRLWKRQKIP